jgi:hypothetical protein
MEDTKWAVENYTPAWHLLLLEAIEYLPVHIDLFFGSNLTCQDWTYCRQSCLLQKSWYAEVSSHVSIGA